jgi:tetratricopeptide (TPR) repeat protein
MSTRAWLIAAVVLAVALGQLAYVYAKLPPRLEILGPITPESPIGIAYSTGGAAYRAGNYQKAVDIYTDYLAHESNTNRYAMTIFGERARAYEALKQDDLAEADLTAAIGLAPKSFAYSAYADRGLFYARRKRDLQAEADFKTGAKLDPKNGVFAYSEGLVLSERTNYAMAIEKFDEAVRLEPKERKYYMERGSALNYLARYGDAQADFTQALAVTNDKYTSARERARANLGRGYAELELGLFQLAIEDFDVVLKAVPRASNALAWQGSAYEGLGDTGRAIAAYRAALAIDPKQARAVEKLKSLQPAQ